MYYVVIPAYQPDEKLIQLLEIMKNRLNCQVIVVDDGSTGASKNILEIAKTYAIVLHHDVNKGKGQALRTAFSFIQDLRKPGVIVIADADGQHAVNDIDRVARAAMNLPSRLILGVRQFTKDIPFRSRFGNKLTRVLFRLQTGVNVSDTQTGLRGFHAILAVNGDYYGANSTGYVIKNGVLYRDTVRDNAAYGDLAIYADGSFEVIYENEITAQELIDKGVINLLAFGPSLVENGEIVVDTSTEVGRAMSSNPRSAIGIIDENHYIIVVADGRTSESQGLSLYQLAEVMKQYGAQTAYNLDGGGSSTLYFNGQVINNPTTNGNTISERAVSDIVYIGY